MKKSILGLLILFFFVGLIGCTTGQNVKKDTQAPAKTDVKDAETVVPLEKSYRTLLVYPYTTTPVLQKDYVTELKESQATLITSLLMAEVYSKAGPANQGAVYNEAGTLLIKIKVADMRIAGTSARIWGGVFAGNSYMHMNVQFVDAATGELVHEKFFSSTNSSMAAAWTFGATDKSLPSDLAKIVAEYVLKKVKAGK